MPRKPAGKKKPLKRARRGRGEGSVHWHATLGVWVATAEVGRDPVSGKRRRLSCYGGTKKEAMDKLAEARTDAGALTRGRGDVPLLVDHLLAWLRARGRDWAPGTAREHTRHVVRHILGVGKDVLPKVVVEDLDRAKVHGLGLARLDRIVRADVEGLLSTLLTAGVPRPTVAKVLTTTLAPALAWAVECGIITSNPADGVTPPKHTAAEKVHLDAGQLRRFLEAAEPTPLFAMWMFSADTGCRQGEAFGLAWSDLDLDAGVVHFRRSLEELDGHLRLKELKNRHSRRTVKLAARTLAALGAHRDAQHGRDLAGTDAPVFTDTGGGHLRKSNTLRRSFRPIVARANALEVEAAKKEHRPARPIPAGFTPHGLRHTSATLLLSSGVDIVTVSRRLGHAKVSITLDTYSHALGHNADRAAQVLDGILGGGG